MLQNVTTEPDPWKYLLRNEPRHAAERALIQLRRKWLGFQLWITPGMEFVLSYRTAETGHRICTNLTEHSTMQELVTTVPYGMDTVFVFLTDVGWLLDFYHFDLHSMEVYSWLCPPERAVESVKVVDVTKIDAPPGEQEGLVVVLGPERQLWDTVSEPVRKRFVFHRGVDFQGYLCLRRWFESYWDVELLMMAPSADLKSTYPAMLATARSTAQAAGGEAIISMVPDQQERLCRSASKGGWQEVRQEVRIYRPVQA